jgi:hypothetical protein
MGASTEKSTADDARPPADARDTLYLSRPSTVPTGEVANEQMAPAARAPLASPVILIALVALAAWAFRKRR